MRGTMHAGDKPVGPPQRTGRHVPKGTYAVTAPDWVQEMQAQVDKQAGTRLNKLLQERDMTHRELAELLGLSQGAVRHRVYGRTPLSLSEAVVVAYHLNIDVAELAGPVAEPGSPSDESE